MGFGFQEFMTFVVIIVILNITGLWDVVMRGIRELRGERVDPPPSVNSSKGDVELSFRLLGLSPSAQWEEVERAYRQKAKIHHPDRGGDEDTMRALNEAYALIKRTRGR
jgi:hypothetical protein